MSFANNSNTAKRIPVHADPFGSSRHAKAKLAYLDAERTAYFGDNAPRLTAGKPVVVDSIRIPGQTWADTLLLLVSVLCISASVLGLVGVGIAQLLIHWKG